jgi:hypothetical protein
MTTTGRIGEDTEGTGQADLNDVVAILRNFLLCPSYP